MKRAARFGLIALLPAAFGITSPGSASMTLRVCGGDGSLRTLEVPLREPGTKREPCCQKGCHGASSRKKSAGKFEPSQ